MGILVSRAYLYCLNRGFSGLYGFSRLIVGLNYDLQECLEL